MTPSVLCACDTGPVRGEDSGLKRFFRYTSCSRADLGFRERIWPVAHTELIAGL